MRHSVTECVRNVGSDIGCDLWKLLMNSLQHDATNVQRGGSLNLLDGRFDYTRYLKADGRFSKLPAQQKLDAGRELRMQILNCGLVTGLNPANQLRQACLVWQRVGPRAGHHVDLTKVIMSVNCSLSMPNATLKCGGHVAAAREVSINLHRDSPVKL
jgi:hypothetical protein